MCPALSDGWRPALLTTASGGSGHTGTPRAGPALPTEAASPGPQRSPRRSNQFLCLQPGQVVGVDLEWRPSFGAGGRPQVSLMQVAVAGRVFLLDLPRLSSPAGGQAPRAFSQLVSRLLSDPSITKLGQ